MTQSDFWNKLKKRLRDVSSAAADFTEEQALIGKLKFEILTLKRKIDRKQREIGEKICLMSELNPKPDPFKDKEIKVFLKEIVDLEKQSVLKRDGISEVANQVRAKGVDTDDLDTEIKLKAVIKPPAKKRGKPQGSKAKTTKKPSVKKKPATVKKNAKPKKETSEKDKS